MTFPFTPETCPGYAPGMALPHNVCERCGGDRQRDHVKGQRAEAVHYVEQNRTAPPSLTKDQKTQGVRKLGPFPTDIEYPCGCKASGGTGIEPLPDYCPSHGPFSASNIPAEQASRPTGEEKESAEDSTEQSAEAEVSEQPATGETPLPAENTEENANAA